MLKKRLIFAIILFLYSQYGIATPVAVVTPTPDILKNISVTNLDGSTTTLDSYRDEKPLYLKFWATWCQPCIEQMPHLQSTYEKYGKKIRIIAVNIDVNDSLQEIQNTKKKFNLSVPMAIDKTGDLSHAFNLIGTPYHILISKEGNIVFKGHEASEKLNNTIAKLTKPINPNLAELVVSKPEKEQFLIDTNKGNTALFFTATWCDEYFKDSRPKMSNNCIAAQNEVNSLSERAKEFKWTGVISRLWTGDKELKKYKEKYNIKYPLAIDVNDQEYRKYKVKEFPTVIVFKNGKEVFRTSDFTDLKQLYIALQIKE